jgi:hypothetical protein
MYDRSSGVRLLHAATFLRVRLSEHLHLGNRHDELAAPLPDL